jgi:hypothetical protein
MQVTFSSGRTDHAGQYSRQRLFVRDYAGIIACLDFGGYAINAMQAKPRSIIAHVEDSGTSDTLPIPELNRKPYCPGLATEFAIEKVGSTIAATAKF